MFKIINFGLGYANEIITSVTTGADETEWIVQYAGKHC